MAPFGGDRDFRGQSLNPAPRPHPRSCRGENVTWRVQICDGAASGWTDPLTNPGTQQMSCVAQIFPIEVDLESQSAGGLNLAGL